jgi:hypothetical protein
MALTVPLMLSSGAANGMVGNAYFEENAGGRLAFDLRIAIPTVKLVEALLCYQNRLQEVVPQGQWEELPTASAEASQGIAASMSASTIAKKARYRKSKGICEDSGSCQGYSSRDTTESRCANVSELASRSAYEL